MQYKKSVPRRMSKISPLYNWVYFAAEWCEAMEGSVTS